jgi:hypothetical protein
MKIDTLRMSDVLKEMTMTITIKRDVRFKIGTWLGVRIMRLGARLVGFGTIRVEST